MNLHSAGANQQPAAIHSGSGATARPFIRQQNGEVLLDAVEIESEHPSEGYGAVFLTPDQVLEIHARLSQIAVAFLHENRWGGEDPSET